MKIIDAIFGTGKKYRKGLILSGGGARGFAHASHHGIYPCDGIYVHGFHHDASGSHELYVDQVGASIL